MAQPSTRQELIDYCLRQLGAPVVEINVAEEQIQDLVDDAVQYFNERHFDGVEQVYLKYQITQADIDRAKARPPGAPDAGSSPGIVNTQATASIDGSNVTFNFYENSNYIQVPPSIIGINKVFQWDDSATSTNSANMFNFEYQLFLNDIYFFGTTDILSYSMAKGYLETLNFLLNTHKQIRFNQRQDRLYLDTNFDTISKDKFLIIDCWRQMDGNNYSRVWNDSFLKLYLTSLIKRQWGQNLMKFTGVKLPGGVEFNGRQIYDDGQREIDELKAKMLSTYELPPLDLIG